MGGGDLVVHAAGCIQLNNVQTLRFGKKYYII